MKLYLANKFSEIDATKAIADELTAAGHEVVSTWVYGGEDGLSLPEIAWLDDKDVRRADAVVKISYPYGSLTKGGGRHTEMGIAMGLGKRVFVVGPPEQIFDWHPAVLNFPTVGHLIRYLKGK